MNRIEQISVSLWFLMALLLAGPAFVGCRFMKEPNSERGKFIRAIFHGALWSYILSVIPVMAMGFTVIPSSFYVVLGLVEILSGAGSRQLSFFYINILISVVSFILATFVSRMFIKDFFPDNFDDE